MHIDFDLKCRAGEFWFLKIKLFNFQTMHIIVMNNALLTNEIMHCWIMHQTKIINAVVLWCLFIKIFDFFFFVHSGAKKAKIKWRWIRWKSCRKYATQRSFKACPIEVHRLRFKDVEEDVSNAGTTPNVMKALNTTQRHTTHISIWDFFIVNIVCECGNLEYLDWSSFLLNNFSIV